MAVMSGPVNPIDPSTSKAWILPFETRTNGTGLGSREVLLAIQYNIFDCGGVAIGFDAANFFPKKDMHWYNPDNFTTKDKVMRRLLFDKSRITALREKASPTADSQVKQHYFPTRVEAISTLILGCLMAIYKSRPAPAKFILARDVVNLRVRMVPPMPIHSFGNLWYNASAVVLPNENIDNENNFILKSKLNNTIK
ncbi:(13S,14R)-1,13-dihydroxy-N-methylcanadine 13-O-acetyltransferase AT1-like [Carya illinoinensis]|uniref:(13S,14R)-1,13-dihydroxy-N-methylcanadine 13-O-acetyltransferase AT1-like n=1 Tax=Carya illinoinensis TaxID=32201 RepID=UPI001C729C3F|nr:(13S,14R)-1,13-dihydroxy-N-methylcanadine 13-O-acetyltransferase AT1-like [Carya illinoinensis]